MSSLGTSHARRRCGWLLRAIVFVHHLAGLDAHAQAILRRRQRAGRIWVIRTGRVISFIEIESEDAIFRQGRIEETRSAVSFFAAGQIAENEFEALGARLGGLEAIFRAAQSENNVAGR